MSSRISATVIPFRGLSSDETDFSIKEKDQIALLAQKAMGGERLEELSNGNPFYVEEESSRKFGLQKSSSSVRRQGSMAPPEERISEISRESQNLLEAENLIGFANDALFINPGLACTHLLNAAKIHYQTAAATLIDWVKNNKISEEETISFFSEIKGALDLYRYKDVDDQKNQILEVAKSIDLKWVRSPIEEDVQTLIYCVSGLLKDLKIEYHNIQHTLEVTLGTIQSVSQHVKNGFIRDAGTALLPVVAALFHDIAYSNNKEVINLIKELIEEQYLDLFQSAKGESFVSEFQEQVRKMEQGDLTGAEMHKYHVQLSQVLLPLIIKAIPDSNLPHKAFLLRQNSLEKINAMIALTDIKPDLTKYRESRRDYLEQHGLLTAADSLVTSDLLTQLSTSDRLSKGLALYHEFYLGQDAKFWYSGLSLMSTASGFYENVAKLRFDPKALSVLDSYFASNNESNKSNSINPYRQGNEIIFFFHKLLEPLYEKLTSGASILDSDIRILNGLQINGLQQEVVDLFIATQSLRNNKPVPVYIKNTLDKLLQEKGSLLEISIGDEVRLSMMLGAQSCNEMVQYLDLYRPEILIARSADFLSAYRRLKTMQGKDSLLEAIELTVQKIPQGTKGLIDLENELFPRKNHCCIVS